MEWSFDVVALCSALGGAIFGALGAAWQGGARRATLAAQLAAMNAKRDEQFDKLSIAVEHLSEKTTLVLDELARRLTILENRYQYDGMYIQPRTGHGPAE